MRELTAICQVSVKSFTDEGSFDAAAQRLGALCALGFDGVALRAFDDSCGSSRQLLSLVARARDLGLCVVLDLACLTGGVQSPAAFIDMAVRQGLSDGFLLTEADLRFEDVLPTITRLQKERSDLYFSLDAPPQAGARPDGIARCGYRPDRLSDDDASVSTAWQSLGKYRQALTTPLAAVQETDARAHLRMDAALLLAYMLPGVPHIDAGCECAVHSTRPTDADAFAARRRTELLRTLARLRRTCPALASPKTSTRMDTKDGTLTLLRRTCEGTWQLYLRMDASEGTAFDRAPSTRPLLSFGLIRRADSFGLVPYGYALYFVPKVQKSENKAPTEDETGDVHKGQDATYPAEDAQKLQTNI